MTTATLSTAFARPQALPADWKERAAGWAGIALSAAVLLLIAHQLGEGGLARLAKAAAGGSFAFWATFVVAYFASPVCEWVIFARLWRLPASGILALLRKEVSNELLFGYSGEASFYLWARRHVRMAGSPFGAVKDVAVLSALAGNLATLLLMAANTGALARFAATPGARPFAGSVAVIVAISLALFLFRRAVFSLSRRRLAEVFGIHLVRIALHVGLSALMWHLLLPTVPLAAWMGLATLRQMITRLPLVSNKDILFAGAAVLLLGRDNGAADVIATVSTLIVGAHLLAGVAATLAPLAARAIQGR